MQLRGKAEALPNLIYTDGNAFSLWRDGKQIGDIIHLESAVRSSGKGLASSEVTLADPAVCTGTFLLGVLGSIAATVAADEGPGSGRHHRHAGRHHRHAGRPRRRIRLDP